MKKLFALMLTLVLMLSCAAFAEEDEMTMPEAAAVFSGSWVCGRASIDMDWEEEGFRVFISWSSSASEVTEWEYSCLYQADDNSLAAMPTGIRTDVVYGDDGEVASYQTVYEDGDAVFTLDEDGFLLWKDLKEDAGKDMRFEHVEIVSPEEAM